MYFVFIFSSLYLSILYILRKKNISYTKIISISSLLLYIIPIILVQYNKHEIENEMKKYDINNDGFYSKNEINYEYAELENQLISDTGSHLFILIGFPLSLIYSTFMVSLYKISNYIYFKLNTIK